MIIWGQTRRGRTDWQPSCVLYHRQPPFVKTLLTRDDLCSLIGNIGYRRNRKHLDWQLLRKLGGGKQEGFNSFRCRCISNRQMCLWSGLLKRLVLRQNLYPRRYRATMKWVRASKLICIFKCIWKTAIAQFCFWVHLLSYKYPCYTHPFWWPSYEC